jgi:CspA family cold shock protein
MSSQLQSAACQRCGSGFVLTTTYRDLLSRRGARVVVPLLCPTCFLTEGPLPKQRGEVKWYNARKRYGFIVSEEGEEVFFHQQQVFNEDEARPASGQPVRFHIHYPIKGPEALNVELLGE